MMYAAEIPVSAALSRVQARLKFLLRASGLLGGQLDGETALAALVQLAVPLLADWCTIDLLDGGTLRRVATAHADPARMEWLGRLSLGQSPVADGGLGTATALRTGQVEFHPEIPETLLAATVRDPEQREILRRLGCGASIVAPLPARGRVLGALTLVVGD